MAKKAENMNKGAFDKTLKGFLFGIAIMIGMQIKAAGNVEYLTFNVVCIKRNNTCNIVSYYDKTMKNWNEGFYLGAGLLFFY